jgi:hypothetical protein
MGDGRYLVSLTPLTGRFGPLLIDKRRPIRLTRFDSRAQIFETFDIAQFLYKFSMQAYPVELSRSIWGYRQASFLQNGALQILQASWVNGLNSI